MTVLTLDICSQWPSSVFDLPATLFAPVLTITTTIIIMCLEKLLIMHIYTFTFISELLFRH